MDKDCIEDIELLHKLTQKEGAENIDTVIYCQLLQDLAKNGLKNLKKKQPEIYEKIELTLDASSTPAGISENDKISFEEIKKVINELLPGDDVIKQNYHKPQNLIMGNTKLQNLLFDESKNSALFEKCDINVSKPQKPVLVTAQVYMLDNDNCNVSAKLTPFQKEVYNGIMTIYASEEQRNGTEAANKAVFTDRQVYEAFAGKGTYHKEQLEETQKAIDFLRMTLCNIDWTQHAKMLNADCKSIVIKENLLHLRSVTIESNGQKATGYQFLAPPVLYRYAKTVKQIVTVNRKLLDVNVSNTQTAILLKNYMLRRIELMTSDKNKIANNNIVFESMFADCSISCENKTQTKRLKDTVYKILESWKEQKYIKGFNEVRKGKKIYAVEIIL